MKVIILAAGQGTRLRPLTDDRTKLMVEGGGKTILERQLDTMRSCGVRDDDITIVSGYRNDVLIQIFENSDIHVIVNQNFETTNMVCSLMCARKLMQTEDDIIVSYGDIIYNADVFRKILTAQDPMSVIVDDGWYGYWSVRCENPLEDAETLLYDEVHYLLVIGQNSTDLN